MVYLGGSHLSPSLIAGGTLVGTKIIQAFMHASALLWATGLMAKYAFIAATPHYRVQAPSRKALVLPFIQDQTGMDLHSPQDR